MLHISTDLNTELKFLSGKIGENIENYARKEEDTSDLHDFSIPTEKCKDIITDLSKVDDTIDSCLHKEVVIIIFESDGDLQPIYNELPYLNI